MTREQDVLDFIDAQHDLAERHSSFEAAVRYGLWQMTGVLRHYDYDKSSPTHLRALRHSLL
jgi:hypothetical protein